MPEPEIKDFPIFELVAEGEYKFPIHEALPQVSDNGKGCINVRLDLRHEDKYLFMPLWGAGAWHWAPILRLLCKENRIKCPDVFKESGEVIDVLNKLRQRNVKLPVKVGIREDNKILSNTTALRRE